MTSLVREQVVLAIGEADVVLFMVDCRSGLVPADYEISDLLRRTGKRTLLVVNKVDGRSVPAAIADFYRLGISEPIGVSALHGRQVGDLLDRLVAELPAVEPEPAGERVRVAVVGKPNVGKSSLVNCVLGEERMIVDEAPGTTRDSIDTPVTYEGYPFVLVDTAGLRRRTRIRESWEFYITLRTLRSVERCHVALSLFDCSEPMTRQDIRVAALPPIRGRGVVLVAHKADLVSREDRRYVEAATRRQLHFLDYAPLVFASAVTGEGVSQAMSAARTVNRNWSARVDQEELSRIVQDAVKRYPPPSKGKGRVLVTKTVQTATRPPRFVVYATRPEAVQKTYIRYLSNRLRDALGLEGVPFRISLVPVRRRSR